MSDIALSSRRVLRHSLRSLRDGLTPSLAHALRLRLPAPFLPGHDRQRTIFIHVPKAAGTSVKKLIFAEPMSGPEAHAPIARFRIADPARTAAYFKFCFVRNPYDRLLSAHTYLTGAPGRTPADIDYARTHLAELADFESFVLSLDSRRGRWLAFTKPHFRPQSDFVCLPGQAGHAMDFVGRFETLEEDMQQILARLRRSATALPHQRPSQRGHYREAYSARMRRIVERAYARDLALFGYDF